MMEGSFLRMMLGTYSALGTLDEISYKQKTKKTKHDNEYKINQWSWLGQSC